MMMRGALKRRHEQLLEEILARVRSMQDSIDSRDVEEILKDPEYRRALQEAEEDIAEGRVRPLDQVLRGLRRGR